MSAQNILELMKQYRYTWIGILTAMLYWLADSTVHLSVLDESNFEIWPSDANEIWMRSMIFVLLVAFGRYVDHAMKRLLQQEHEKYQIFIATIGASHHILNNYLTKMQMFRMEARNCPNFTEEKLQHYDEIMRQTAEELQKLGELSEPDSTSIHQHIYPR